MELLTLKSTSFFFILPPNFTIKLNIFISNVNKCTTFAEQQWKQPIFVKVAHIYDEPYVYHDGLVFSQ